jgi:hypothetical protein
MPGMLNYNTTVKALIQYLNQNSMTPQTARYSLRATLQA